MHTPTAFILRRADSPSYFNPGDSPSHHLSHPLTAGPHTLSKHISFFLCCFLYFFIFSLLSFLPSVLPPPLLFFSRLASLFLSALLLPRPVRLLASLSQWCAFFLCFLCSAAASLYPAILHFLRYFCDAYTSRRPSLRVSRLSV